MSQSADLLRALAEAHMGLEAAQQAAAEARRAYEQASNNAVIQRALPRGSSRTITLGGDRLLTVSLDHNNQLSFTYSDLVTS